MYFVGKLRLFAAVAMLLPLSAMPLQSAPPASPASCVVPTPSLDGPGISDDVCGASVNFHEFGNMAWQTFKTLVWPASGRGEADTLRELADMVGSRVFETYKADWETFQNQAAEPLAWHRYPDKAPICANADAMKPPLDRDSLVLASLHKFGNLDQIDFDRNDAKIFHLLVTQKGSLVRYLTGFNKLTFNTIRNNGLYGPVTVKFSEDPPVPPRYFDPGSINIKSAWIEMDGISDPGSFYTRWAWVQKPHHDVAQRTCDLKLMGLVALHIAHKTKSSPQWIWASFEHVRNVPSGEKLAEKKDYTFNDGLGTTPMETDPPPGARFPFPLDKPFKIPNPYNVERQKKIPTEIRDINVLWQGVLKDTVWSNYELVMVQWPRRRFKEELTGSEIYTPERPTAYPVPPCGEVPSDINIANTVIETFLQLDATCGKNRTCMGCHNLTRNYDFIWSIPTKDKEPGKAAISVLRQNLWGQPQ